MYSGHFRDWTKEKLQNGISTKPTRAQSRKDFELYNFILRSLVLFEAILSKNIENLQPYTFHQYLFTKTIQNIAADVNLIFFFYDYKLGFQLSKDFTPIFPDFILKSFLMRFCCFSFDMFLIKTPLDATFPLNIEIINNIFCKCKNTIFYLKNKTEKGSCCFRDMRRLISARQQPALYPFMSPFPCFFSFLLVTLSSPYFYHIYRRVTDLFFLMLKFS